MISSPLTESEGSVVSDLVIAESTLHKPRHGEASANHGEQLPSTSASAFASGTCGERQSPLATKIQFSIDSTASSILLKWNHHLRAMARCSSDGPCGSLVPSMFEEACTLHPMDYDNRSKNIENKAPTDESYVLVRVMIASHCSEMANETSPGHGEIDI